MSEPCRLLEWDSRFFGARIGRVSGERLSPEDLERALAWAKKERVDCLYYLCGGDGPAVRAAEERGFRVVDARLTLDRALDGPLPAGGGRPGTPADLETLAAIARVSHADSRFYADERFPRDRCAQLYALWIERSLREEAVFVAEADGKPAGYITCGLAEGEGRIGLFAVAEAGRGKGLGQGLIGRALEWSRKQGAKAVSVVTQGRNVAGQRAYGKAGFLPRRFELWLHGWRP